MPSVFKKAAGAVVFCHNHGKIEYLLLRHSERYWNFPKGGVEKGEREIDAAKREVFEETGLKDIKIISGFAVREKYFYRSSKDYGKMEERNKNILKLVIFYLAESKTKDVKISHEHEDYKWLTFEKCLEQLGKNRSYRKSQEILKKANGFITKLDNKGRYGNKEGW